MWIISFHLPFLQTQFQKMQKLFALVYDFCHQNYFEKKYKKQIDGLVFHAGGLHWVFTGNKKPGASPGF
jgi:hypothetical protein